MKIIRPIAEYSINRNYIHDIEINEKFIMNNNRYIVVLNRALNCKDCSFNCRIECASVKCAANERSDRKSVSFHIFKDYENNKKNKFKKWFWSLFNRG